MKIGHLVLALLSCLLACTGSAGAAGFRPIVTAVGADTITVQIMAKAGLKVTDIDDDGNHVVEPPDNIVTYQVTAFTRVVVDGLPSTLADVQPGMTVNVTQGADRTVAGGIVASTVPPAASSKEKARKLFNGVYTSVVLGITPDRITYGSPGTAHALAAFITSSTRIYSGGQRAEISSIGVGMKVDVSTVDGVHADTIRVADPGS